MSKPENIDQRIAEEAPLNDIWYYIDKAVYENRLIFIAITSSAQGALPMEGFPFGQGKSDLGMALSRDIYQKRFDLSTEEAEDKVKENMGYPLDDVKKMLRKGRVNRVPCHIQDDWQIPAGKHMSHERKAQKLAGILSSARPYVAVFITTQPDIADIAKCFRDLYMFEIKVPFRGLCEIQMLKTYTDFHNPLFPYQRLVPAGKANISPVSSRLRDWYEGWRDRNFSAEFESWVDEYLDDEAPTAADKPDKTPEEVAAASEAGRAMARARWGYKPEKDITIQV